MAKTDTFMVKSATQVKWANPSEINQRNLFNHQTIMILKLSKRELEIIKKVAGGYRTLEIADMLCISPHTVKTHRRNVLRKMEVINFSSVVNECIKNRWIEVQQRSEGSECG